VAVTFARLVPASYREVVAVDRVPTLLWAYFVSYLGDSMSAVTIAWLAIEIAPADSRSLLVGASVAAYALPGVVGAVAHHACWSCPTVRCGPSYWA
jgi:hypothetical protein